MELNLRKAKENDMEDVLLLIRELASFENEPEMVEVTVSQLKEDGFGVKPAFEVIVAEADQQIVGMALFYFRYSTWKGKTIHVEDLIVKESFRGMGIGRKLYTEVLKYAHGLGLKRVEWNVLDWNKVAIDFYASTGAKMLKDWRVVQMDEKGLNQFISQNHASS